MDHVDCVVILVEAEPRIGTGTSSRNSGVIHAGIYHPTGSLKARLGVQGRELLYEYCEAHSIAHQRCGHSSWQPSKVSMRHWRNWQRMRKPMACMTSKT